VGKDTQSRDIDPGVVTRLEQANAKQAKALLALGVNPESTALDQYEKGLLSAEDLRRLTTPVQMPTRGVEQTPPQKTPAQVLRETVAKVRQNKDATLEDFETLVDCTAQYIEQNESTREQSLMAQQAQNCQQAVYNVFDSGDNPITDNEVKMTEREMFFAATDLAVSTDARKTQNPYAMMTPETYQFYANREAERLGKVKEAYIELGRKLEREGIPPAPAKQIPTPAAPGQGAPVRAPKVKINVDNMQKAREAYMHNYNRQV
jgi:hypothetical protein